MHSLARAGLVALVFALIIPFVSAIPIPVTEPGLSTSALPPPPLSLNGKDHYPLDAPRISEISSSGRIMSESTFSAATSVLTRRYISTDTNDEQLVRRNKVTDFFRHIGRKIKEGFQTFGRKVKEGFQTVGRKVKEGFQTVGRKVKEGFQTAGRAMKKGFQKVGEGIKYAAKKVWGFMKTTGAKIAKFGLKVVESVGEVVGKVISFIPGIGKPIQQAIHGVSKLAGMASDHIKADLPKNLQKGMDVMNKANNIMNYIP